MCAVAAVTVKEGREAWRGEIYCAVPGLDADQGCGRGPGCTDVCCADAPRTRAGSAIDG